VRIKEALLYKMDVSEIITKVDECVSNGAINIAIAFSPADHIYTSVIRIIVQSRKAISAHNGKLVLITPTEEIREEILEILKLLGLANEIRLFGSEKEL
jgi:anti-anti-sigma regulatory factor